jgi:Polysaccharide biosynthesis C-terminal domain
VAVQTSFIRCDSYILDAALQPGRRVQVSAAAAVVAVVLSLLLTRYAGMIGLCVGVLAGRSIQTFWYPALVRRSLGDSTDRWLLRPLSTMALLFAAAAYLAPRVRVEHWAAWAVGVLLSAVGSSGILLLWGLPADLRGAIQVRVVELAGKLGVRAVGRQR